MSSSHANVTEPRSDGTALVVLFAEQGDAAGSRLGCALGRGMCRSLRTHRSRCRSRAFTPYSERQPRAPQLQQSSVSPESREGDDEPGTLRQLRSKIFPCYRQLTLPCKAPVPVSSGAQKEHSSRPGSTSITADAQEGAQCNLRAERHLKMRGKKKTTNRNSLGASDRCTLK